MSVLRDPQLDRSLARWGFALVDLLSGAETAHLGEVFRTFAEHYQGGFAATVLSGDTAHRAAVDRAMRDVLAPRISEVLRDYRAVCCGFAVKRPAAGGVMPLHQDITMVPSEARPGLSLWVPLIDVDATGGCLELVPGSHLLNRLPRAPGTPFAAARHEAELRARHLFAVPMRAGQGLLMDQALFHCSAENRSPRVRAAVAVPLAPREERLVYYHRLAEPEGARLEGFAVAESFYLEHRLGTRPLQGECLGTQREAAAPIPVSAIRALPQAGDGWDGLELAPRSRP